MARDEQTKPGRRERRRQEVRERVLEAASALFEKQGYDATPVAQICERADIAYGTFFNHFPEKHDVLRMMAEGAVGTVEETLEGLAKAEGTIEEHLTVLFSSAVQEYATDDRLRRDLLRRILAIAYTESPEDTERRYHSAFVRYMQESVARGRVRDDVPIDTLADVVASMVSSFSLSWVHVENFPIRERSAVAAQLLAESLQPRPRSPTTAVSA